MAVRTFDDFLAEQALNENIGAILGNVFKMAGPAMKGLLQKAGPMLTKAAEQYGPQMVQSAAQQVITQMGNGGAQQGQPGQVPQQTQAGQAPQTTQQRQTTQQSQMPQTPDPQNSKAFEDLLQASLNQLAIKGTQAGMNALGSMFQGRQTAGAPTSTGAMPAAPAAV